MKIADEQRSKCYPLILPGGFTPSANGQIRTVPCGLPLLNNAYQFQASISPKYLGPVRT